MEKAVRLVEVRGRIIGGGRPQVCMPLVARTEQQLIQEAEALVPLEPDLVEWRADYLEEAENIPAVIRLLGILRERLKGYPIIFTCRVESEGGCRKIDETLRLALIKEVIRTQQADIIDIELAAGAEKIKETLDLARENDLFTILSSHDFKKTPSVEAMIDGLIQAQALGADIAKLAVMPNSMEDVLNLLYATHIACEKHVQIPVITMSMSEKGMVSRIAGGLFGSSVTFGAGRHASAPGQIVVSELKTALKILHQRISM